MRSMALGGSPTEGNTVAPGTLRMISTGSSLEGLFGAGTAVLAILALCGILSATLTAIATIAAGCALVSEGGSVASRFRDLHRQAANDTAGEMELAAGTSFELLGGLAAIVLGILAILGVMPNTLIAIAAIGLGAALLLGSGSTSRLDHLTLYKSQMNDATTYLVHESIIAASSIQALAGMGALALGILSLLQIDVRILNMVSMLAIGGALFLCGAAVLGKVASIFSH